MQCVGRLCKVPLLGSCWCSKANIVLSFDSTCLGGYVRALEEVVVTADDQEWLVAPVVSVQNLANGTLADHLLHPVCVWSVYTILITLIG